jgi:high-affinity iron transporter
VIANLLIGFREGLEAALIVSILIAYLVKTGRQKDTVKVWLGTGSAVLLSIAAGLALSLAVATTPEGINELIAGLTSIAAAGFVTWMVFWMARQSRAYSAELKNQLEAKATGTFAVVSIAFLAVIREGLETSVFLWSTSRASGEGVVALWGAFVGLSIAALLGVLMYRGSIRLNLSKFFKFSGAALIVIAAGILSYGLHELQEIGIISFWNQTAYDLSNVIAPDSAIESILKGTVSFSATPSILMVAVWLAYVMLTSVLYFRKPKTS